MMKENNSNPLSFVDECFAELNVHSAKIQMCAMTDVKTCFEALQYL